MTFTFEPVHKFLSHLLKINVAKIVYGILLEFVQIGKSHNPNLAAI